MNGNQILVEAKKEYTKSLCGRLMPHLIETFVQMYEEAKKMSKGKNVLLQYQELLKDVKQWNNNMIKKHCEEVTNSCSHFSDLLAAVFVAYVKILSSVRYNQQAKKISIPLPSNETFIHRVMENSARDLYEDPTIMQMKDDNQKLKDLRNRFNESIETSITELVPIPQILETYMSKKEEGIDLLGEEDSPDPEIEEEEEEVEKEEEEDVIPESVEKIIGEPESAIVQPDTPLSDEVISAYAKTPVAIQDGLEPKTPVAPETPVEPETTEEEEEETIW